MLNFVEIKGKQKSLKGSEEENEQPTEEDRGDTSEIRKDEGRDKYHEIVKEERNHMNKPKDEEHDIIKKDAREREPTIDENRMQDKDDKELKEDVEKSKIMGTTSGDINKRAVIDKTVTNKISGTLLTCLFPVYKTL